MKFKFTSNYGLIKGVKYSLCEENKNKELIFSAEDIPIPKKDLKTTAESNDQEKPNYRFTIKKGKAESEQVFGQLDFYNQSKGFWNKINNRNFYKIIYQKNSQNDQTFPSQNFESKDGKYISLDSVNPVNPTNDIYNPKSIEFENGEKYIIKRNLLLGTVTITSEQEKCVNLDLVFVFLIGHYEIYNIDGTNTIAG